MPNNWQGDNFEFRRKFQKVSQDRITGDVVLRLHETDIVRVRPNGDVILSTGGWATHKTMSSMNDALELFSMYVDTASGSPPQGRWQVTDSDGSVHSYNNDKHNFMTTIRSKGPEDKGRAQWLAEAYGVTYTAPTAPTGPRVATAAAPQGPRIAAPQPAGTSNGLAPSAQSAPAAVPGVGGSWANIARRANPLHAANTGGAPAGRMTGPGGSSAAAAGRVTGPGAAAAAWPSDRPSGPPGFPPATSTLPPAGASAPPGMSAAGGGGGSLATVTSAPPMPVDAQLYQQMAQLGIDQHELEDDAHLCVVCMEEPRSIVLVPCGHMALCKDCCEQIIVAQQQKCPMCCQDVEYHVEVDQ